MGGAFDRPCWAEIDTAALRRNLTALRQRLPAGVSVLSVVKANAYGHGLVETARVVTEAGAAWLGVTSLEEGLRLRDAQISASILILGSLFPFDHFSLLFERRLTPTVASLEAAQVLDAMAQRRRERLAVHLKIDTGFGRIGVSAANALEFVTQVARMPGLEVQGLYTHFSSADSDPDWTSSQAQTFRQLVTQLEARGIRPPLRHMANSSAILRHPDTHGTLVRPGLLLYGVPPYPGAEREIALTPAMCLKSRVIFLKQIPEGASVSYARTWVARRRSRIATLAVGYADGLPRLLSNQGQALLGGRRVPIVGRVTMDMTMVDVTDLPSCRVGEEAVLLGAQGADRITAEEWAAWAQTNVYEVLCRIAARVPRVVRP